MYSVRATAFGFQAAIGRVGAILGTVAFGEVRARLLCIRAILTFDAAMKATFDCRFGLKQMDSLIRPVHVRFHIHSPVSVLKY